LIPRLRDRLEILKIKSDVISIRSLLQNNLFHLQNAPCPAIAIDFRCWLIAYDFQSLCHSDAFGRSTISNYGLFVAKKYLDN
jgi:hypothetical protein